MNEVKILLQELARKPAKELLKHRKEIESLIKKMESETSLKKKYPDTAPGIIEAVKEFNRK